MLTLEWLEFGPTPTTCIILRASRAISPAELTHLPEDLGHRVACAELRVDHGKKYYYASIHRSASRFAAIKSEDTLIQLRDELCVALAEVRHHVQKATGTLRLLGVEETSIIPTAADLINNGPFARSGLGQGVWKR